MMNLKDQDEEMADQSDPSNASQSKETTVGFCKQKWTSRKLIGVLAAQVLLFATLFRWGGVFQSGKRSMEGVEQIQVKNERLDTHHSMIQDAHAMMKKAKEEAGATEPPLNNNGQTPNDKVIRHTVAPAVNAETPEEKALEAFRKDLNAYKKPHPSEHIKPPPPKNQITANITVNKPIFVLSLPNNGQLAMNRFFQCANVDPHGRYWTKIDGLQIGHCMNLNRHSGRRQQPILKDCGKFKVWTEMDYDTKESPHGIPKCLFPSLRPDILKELFTTHPQATVINVRKDPDEWYESLSPMIRKRWPASCNGNHNHVFPKADAPKEEWIAFYNRHHQQLRDQVAQYPSVSLIEIDLTAKPVDNAIMLNEKLQVPGKCWWKRAMAKTLPKDISYPIFVTSLPKSATGTTHKYLECGLGPYEGRHQWTHRDDDAPQRGVPIGDCWRDNLANHRPLTSNCGELKFWSNLGTLQPGNKCYYPSFMTGGLEAMYEQYPHATLLHTTREAHHWYESASRGGDNILDKWNRNHCQAFPRANSTNAKAWTDFYDWHTQHVRQFAKDHPTMNYVEVRVEDAKATLQTLQENFGFKSSCWGHANKNNQW